MAGESGFASGDSSGVSPFASGMLPGFGFGAWVALAGTWVVTGEAWMNPPSTMATIKATTKRSLVSKGTPTPPLRPRRPPASQRQPSAVVEQVRQSRKIRLEARDDGVPQEYAQQYFHEAAAKLSYKDPSVNGDDKGKAGEGGYTAADRKFLEQWGYKIGPEVRGSGALGNTDSGMYAVRFEPIDPKSGAAPVVAFRGSEFNEKMVDWRSDLTDGTIGQRQYEGSKKAIDDLMKVAPGQKLEVTGHSLGGALAQKAAAEHAASIGAVTTFQIRCRRCRRGQVQRQQGRWRQGQPSLRL